ncbi:lipoprotein [Erwinia phage pEa_SNUABM_32]|uniref:Lipoprotein n=1 Tax=Erwinia phage pEa_SNUABM_32 TaxID=2869555 RepID=A0AAE7XMD6_9CAUD|nr:lipoprotein [Erwinia phage pEa_SNUABM_32]QZE56611.1 hypothetical protein pEaSNUABM20_00075 [Erwinia phage pEa_SNUABM_20]QZE58291.1 hypothetical protein pEaSNUABM40_00075 [Erwinia phage pEa_SNUABM_40]UAW52856.1 hypothetical protein pEaSNUABM23_00074 [Erwinia phage pEa_SNUABM_23]UIW10752.1 hypothetical protein pEaSNUABM23_00074 [Erwinia phage pEa_SNUABM_31]QZE56948.1 hypothetical protein pEaSNUABM32_00075 [Erwinia phage pEa_SNUABM_32]
MKIITLLLCLLVCGCSSLSSIDAQKKTTMQDIQQINHVEWQKESVPAKPSVVVKVVDDKKVAVLDNKGMVDLINLYQAGKERTEERNKLLDVLNLTIDERNKLLRLAQAEEVRANGLSDDLAAERKARIEDQKSADFQLWLTRIAAAIGIGLAL